MAFELRGLTRRRILYGGTGIEAKWDDVKNDKDSVKLQQVLLTTKRSQNKKKFKKKQTK